MSADPYGSRMSALEITDFLTRQGHGVLSFGGARPYGLPVAFGYDAADGRCVLQLVTYPGSRKQARLAESDAVSLAAYELVDIDDWRSVVIDGRLTLIDPDGPEAIKAAELFSNYASIVGLSAFNRPAAELDPEWYELRITAISGYKTATGGA